VALGPSIGPFTGMAMIPTNFELIERNEERGGKRSERSERRARERGEEVRRVRLRGRGKWPRLWI
jgi:hypothetical protein